MIVTPAPSALITRLPVAKAPEATSGSELDTVNTPVNPGSETVEVALAPTVVNARPLVHDPVAPAGSVNMPSDRADDAVADALGDAAAGLDDALAVVAALDGVTDAVADALVVGDELEAGAELAAAVDATGMLRFNEPPELLPATPIGGMFELALPPPPHALSALAITAIPIPKTRGYFKTPPLD